MNSLADIIQTIAVFALPVLFAITAHEAAHGYVALKLGDNTAAMLGRVTFNPVKHIDPIGTIAIPLALVVFALLAGAPPFLFGYAKPVPVRFGQLKNPRRDMILVALAGPLSNLAQALVWGILFYALRGVGIREQFFMDVCQAGVTVNLVLFAFNLFPLPPLDGGRVLAGLLPPKPAMMLARIEPWGFFIVMILAVKGIIGAIWMSPLMGIAGALISAILYPLKVLVSS